MVASGEPDRTVDVMKLPIALMPSNHYGDQRGHRGELFHTLNEVMPAPIAFVLFSALVFGVVFMARRWPGRAAALALGSVVVAVLIAKTA